MDPNTQFSRSKALNNLPEKKVINYLETISSSTNDEKNKNILLMAANRYAESNIPMEYWSLKMEKDFHGDSRLLEKYNEYIVDLKATYINGSSICFAGNHGLGKTMTVTCILKKASQKGFSCLYTTLSDIVSVLTQSSGEDKFLARRELVMVDFLVIDEFDPRFMPSENAADLYARSLESVFRTRAQNKLPTLMCTNSPNVVESFNGPLKQSIDSLMKGYIKMFPVFGDDFRKMDWKHFLIENLINKYKGIAMPFDPDIYRLYINGDSFISTCDTIKQEMSSLKDQLSNPLCKTIYNIYEEFIRRYTK